MIKSDFHGNRADDHTVIELLLEIFAVQQRFIGRNNFTARKKFFAVGISRSRNKFLYLFGRRDLSGIQNFVLD